MSSLTTASQSGSAAQQRYFDPGMGLPAMLQARLDSWKNFPPKSQFQQYGPLNAYLQGHKFSSGSFLVKPQALLRCLATATQAKTYKKNGGEGRRKSGKKKARYSLDSHNNVVTHKRLYPDFDIDQCYSYRGRPYDVIRVVIEVGSYLEGTTEGPETRIASAQIETAKSLLKYLKVVGNRAHGSLLGIGIVANTVCTVRIDNNGWLERDAKFRPRDLLWTSLFDPSFIQKLDSMLLFCKNDRPNDHMVDNDFSGFTELTVAEDEEDEDENEEAEVEAEVVGTQHDASTELTAAKNEEDEDEIGEAEIVETPYNAFTKLTAAENEKDEEENEGAEVAGTQYDYGDDVSDSMDVDDDENDEDLYYRESTDEEED